jgi:WD40 repeat protein
VLTAAVDGEARLWATPSTKLLAVLRGHRARLTALEFSSDGEQLLTASLDGAARVWTARPLATTDAERVVFHPELLAAHFSPTDELLATTGRDGAVKLWDPRDGKLRRALLGHAYPVHAVGFTPDGRRLLSVSDDGAGRIWDARSGLTLHTLLGHTYPVRSVSIAPSGLLGLTVDLAGIARLWSVRDGLALGLLSEAKLGTVAQAEFSPDGERLVTVTAQGMARLWNVHTLALQTSLPHGQPIRAIDFSPDGSRVLTAATDHRVQLWDTRAAGPLSAPVATLSAPGGELTVARFSPDGLRVVTAATDHTARVFDVAAQQALVTLNEHTGQVRTAAFSPDGLRVLTGDSDGLALLWEATTGKVLRRLTGRGAILAAEFSPDGQSVLLGRQEGDVRVVALSLAPLVSGACRLLRNHEAQWAQVAAVCQPVLAGPPRGAATPSDGGSSADAGLWAPGPTPDGGVLDAPAWRREVAPRSHEIPAGCFAFSAKLHAAACRIRYRTSAARERVAVAFVPPVFPAIAVEPEVGDSVEPRCPPLVWGPALTTLQARLFAGDFSPLLASAYRPLQEGSELPLGTSGAYLSWLADRRAKPPRPAGHGQSEGTLQVRCASGKRLVLHTYKSLDEQVTAAVATVPDGKRLSFRVAISTPVPATTADSAPSRADREEKVMLLDPRSCAIQTPAAPDLL